MEQEAHVDISQYTFDEFVSFLFDHEVPEGPPHKRNLWYSGTEITHIPSLTCKHYIRLFLQPRFLLERFSKAQLEQGFWRYQAGTWSAPSTASWGIRTCPLQRR